MILPILERQSGVYKIENIINGRIYIGRTKNLKTRLNTHINCGNYTKNTTPLALDVREFGAENFIVSILEYHDDIDILNEREVYWIKELDPFYNSTVGGNSFKRTQRGLERILEQKRKVKEKAVINKTPLNKHKQENYLFNAKELITEALKEKIIDRNCWIRNLLNQSLKEIEKHEKKYQIKQRNETKTLSE